MQEVLNLIGYDIGGTKIGIGVGNSAGKIFAKARLDNKDTDPAVILPQLVEVTKKLLAEANLTIADITAFGISSPSPADILNGIIVAPPNNPLWRNVPIRQYLSDELGIEGFFENDANCGMLAEWFFGAGRGAQDVIYLTMSTGIGGGIVAAGHLLHGRNRTAGEVGHVVIEDSGRQCNCGLKGCYEAYCGGRAIAQRMQEELADIPDAAVVRFAGGKLEDVDLVALEKAVRAGDEYACNLWDEMCRRNAQAIGGMINTFNPERIILGTIAWAAGDLFMDPLKKYLPNYAWKELYESCELVPSELRRDIGYYAGIAGALNGLYEAGRYELPWLKK